jgi:hypothetical protein
MAKVKLNGSTSGYVELSAPATAGNNTLTLPTSNGTSGQVLRTDGSGNLSWVSTAGTGPDRVFIENGNTVTTDYTISTNCNAVSSGPITISVGVTVTIPEGQSWAIV